MTINLHLRRSGFAASFGLLSVIWAASSLAASAPSVEEARKIAEEGYIYAFPLVQNYQSIYQIALNPQSDQYKGPMNQVHNVARVFTPADTAIVTPNSDTPYSYIIADLRAEPLVVTLPPIEQERYYSLQIVDLYTHNVDFLGTRKDGNGGGDFLLAGPDWQGEVPSGIKRVVRLGTQLAFTQFRTQLLNAGDLSRVKAIQSGYKVQPLSGYLGQQPPASPEKIDYPSITREEMGSRFWEYANFLLHFSPPMPGEEALRARLARIGVGAGAPWPPTELPVDVRKAVEEGSLQAHKVLAEEVTKLKSSVGLFGPPDFMSGRYKERALGALGGIYGNDAEETFYVPYMRNSDGEALDTGKYNYVITFPEGQLPPVDAFWSMTMYDGKTRFLVDNPIKRYLINSPMVADLKRDSDGGTTLYLQHGSPGQEQESNWLPAPDGLMGMVLRLYLPESEVLDGRWVAPTIRVNGEVQR